MRCFNAVQDDLHDYTAEIQARSIEVLASRPIAVRDFGNVDAVVLHRTGLMQTELIQIQPHAVIPTHSHPGVDSIDLLVSGNLERFEVAGQRVGRLLHGIGIRIAASAAHGGKATGAGVLYLSCQRWDRLPSHIGLAWRGAPSCEEHRNLLKMAEGLEAVR